jgi:predicted DNA-binding transcriptional regulator YafY
MTPRIPTGPRFTPREVPELATTSAGIASGGYRHQAVFRLRASAAEVADRLASSVATVEAVDDTTCLVSTGSNSLDELVLHMGLLGFAFEVVSPPEVADHARTVAARLASA